MLEQEIKTYNDNLQEWLKDHSNQWVVVFDGKLIGFFFEEADALKAGVSEAGASPFLVRRIQELQVSPVNLAYSLGILQCQS